MLCNPIDLWCQCGCSVSGDIYTLHIWPCLNTQSVIIEINQVECGMETKGGCGATRNKSRQAPWAPWVEYGVCPRPRVPVGDETSSLSICICVPRAINLTLGNRNILSTVAFVCLH